MPDPVPRNFQPIDAAKRFTHLTRIFIGDDPPDALLRLVRQLCRNASPAPSSSTKPAAASPPSASASTILRAFHVPRGFSRQHTEAIADTLIRYFKDLHAAAVLYTPTDKERALGELAFLAKHLILFATSDKSQHGCARALFHHALPAFPADDFGASDAGVEWFNDEPFHAAAGLAHIMKFAHQFFNTVPSPEVPRSGRPFTRLLRGLLDVSGPKGPLTKTTIAFLCYAAYVHADQEWKRQTWTQVRRTIYVNVDRLVARAQPRRSAFPQH